MKNEDGSLRRKQEHRDPKIIPVTCLLKPFCSESRHIVPEMDNYCSKAVRETPEPPAFIQ
jgi:hypothetical protein